MWLSSLWRDSRSVPGQNAEDRTGCLWGTWDPNQAMWRERSRRALSSVQAGSCLLGFWFFVFCCFIELCEAGLFIKSRETVGAHNRQLGRAGHWHLVRRAWFCCLFCFTFETVFPLSSLGWLQIQKPPALTSQTLGWQACAASLDREEQAC